MFREYTHVPIGEYMKDGLFERPILWLYRNSADSKTKAIFDRANERYCSVDKYLY
jgi:hypothetical protein